MVKKRFFREGNGVFGQLWSANVPRAGRMKVGAKVKDPLEMVVSGSCRSGISRDAWYTCRPEVRPRGGRLQYHAKPDRSAMDLAPSTTVTFTITSLPKNEAGRKTLNRLMKMQPKIQKGLAMLSRRRRQKENIATSRAGRIWINRKRPTQLTRVEVGETFTLRVSPHIIPDIKSVAAYLDMKAA
jgi:hypothetical protein